MIASGKSSLHFASSAHKRNYDLDPMGDKIYNPDKKPIYYDSYRDLPYQLDVFKDNNLKGKVDYVTMTLGGNDVIVPPIKPCRNQAV